MKNRFPILFCLLITRLSFGQVIINEIMYHPNGGSTSDEFIELYNPVPFPVDLNGWAFDEGVRYTFSNITISASGYLVVAADLAVFTNKYPGVTNVVGNWEGTLSNRGEDIVLKTNLDITSDRVEYADEGDWSKRTRGNPDAGHEGWDWSAEQDGGGKSTELINPTRSNNHGQNWDASPVFGGSPGTENGLYHTNTAPFILDVEHLPVLPSDSEEVNIICRILDEFPGSTATLHYRVDGVSNFTAVAMSDDGTHNDGGPGDGYFGATLPPHATDTVIEFFVEAIDAQSNRRTWPEAIGDATKLLGAWGLDEGTGSIAFDRSGLGNNGVLTNGAMFVTNGVYGGAIQFDGVNDYVILEPNLGSPPPLGAGRFTIATWFQRTGDGSNSNTGSGGINAEPLLTKGRGESDGNIRDANYFMGLLFNGADRVLACDYEEHARSTNPGANNPLVGTTPILDNQWYHAAMVFELGAVKLYLNGVLEAELATGSTPNFDSIQPAALGTALSSTYAPAGYFNGLMDEPLVYRGSLDLTQVNRIKDNLPIIPPLAPQLANCLYQVCAPTPLNGQPRYRVILTAEELAERDQIGSNSSESRSKAQMNATFVSEEPGRLRCRYLVGLRNRGNGSRTYQPNNQRVNFRSDDLWNGVEAINFNAKYTYIQALGSTYFQCTGLPAGDCQPVHFWLNNEDRARPASTMFGSYARVAVTDGDYLKTWYPEDDGGNLYRGIRISSPGANLRYQGTNTNNYRVNYFKHTNTSIDDWSDLIELTDVLENTPDNLYTQEVSRVVNVDQWMRWLAVQAMFDNSETNLGSGNGDDYYFYRGENDPRFVLLPHDFDTILGKGDTIGSPTRTFFRFFGIPVLERLFKSPEYSPIYFRHLLELCDLFEAARFEPLMDEELGSYVPASTTDEMKDFMRQRIVYVRAEIPMAIDVNVVLVNTTAVPFVDGFYQTTSDTVTLQGEAHAVDTRQVTVNGSNATWTAWTANWRIDDFPIEPGINRLIIEAFDAEGNRIDQQAVDVLRDAATTNLIGGTLTSDLQLAAGNSPYRVNSDIVVPAGMTLTIDPGVDLFLDDGVRITVFGRLVAEGTPYQRIQFTRAPGSSNAWDGIFFEQSIHDSRVVHADIAYATASSQSLSVNQSQVLIDSVTFSGTQEKILELDNPSVIIRNTLFPSIGGSETIHGSGLVGNEYLIIQGCTFGSGIGYNDIIDFAGGRRPGPIIQIYSNLFLGASDDVCDLDSADGHIEGNIFMNIHTDDPTRPSSSNAISTDDVADLMIVRNLFYDVDHALLLKNDSRAIFHHNTVVKATIAAIVFDEPVRSGVIPGDYVRVDGSIFQDCADIFEHLVSSNGEDDPVPTVDRSLIPTLFHALGSGNLDADGQLVDPPNDFRLRGTSPARNSGLLGLDRGALVPRWCTVGGIPEGETSDTSLTLPVYGPGVTNFIYRVNNGPYSAEQAIDQPIQLSGLTNGSYTIYVLGQNSAAVWQTEDAVTASTPFTVNTSTPATSIVQINELLADNQAAVEHLGRHPDLVELYNTGDASVDLTDWRFTDDANSFTFPTGTVIAANDFLVLYANTNNVTNEIHLGFSLNDKGERLTLIDATTNVVDTITYGWQLIDYSVGRNDNGEWVLGTPTFGTNNIPVGIGNPFGLKINEWLTAPDGLYLEDFIELYNPAAQPVALGGLYLSDDPVVRPDRYRIPELSFIDGRNFRTFIADDNEGRGVDHLNFNLASDQGWILLSDPDLNEIDRIFYGPQVPDVSRGRSPSGGNSFVSYTIPTPSAGNPSAFITGVVTNTLVDYTDAWKYDETDTAFGNEWKALAFDDSAWLEGAGLLYVEGSALPEPKRTPLNLGLMTYYFRIPFVFDGDPATASLRLTTVTDDAAAIYLNGTEVHRIGFDPDTIIVHGEPADRTTGNANYEGPFTLPITDLVAGTNILAVSVHQADINSSDIVWGGKLEVTTQVLGSIALNEVLAQNRSLQDVDGSYPDWLELYNPGPDAINLSNMGLSDELDEPRKYVFPTNTLVPANDYLLVRCNSALPPSTTNTGFGFSSEGDGVYLFDTPALGGALRDGITFGLQIADYSLSRSTDGEGEWILGTPTLGSMNLSTPLGDPAHLKINEWLASGSLEEDWFELYNPSGLPVELSGLYLSDDLLNRDDFKVAPYSFLGIGTNGYVRFYADNDPRQGADHTSFQLSKGGESIGLFSPRQTLIEQVTYGAQTTDISQGRLPNGTDLIAAFPGSLTPGAPNRGLDSDSDGLPDAWETAYGLNPLNPADAAFDGDLDFHSNLREFLSGTSPINYDSALRLTTEQITGTDAIIGFDTVIGKSYTLECTTDVVNGPWIKVADLPYQAFSRVVQIADPNIVTPVKKYYRAVTPARP